MGRGENEDDNRDNHSSSFFGRAFTSSDNASDSQDGKPPSRFSFNSSFSTSGSVSAATKSSFTQPDHPNHQAQVVTKMIGPFDIHQWWPDHSPSALAFSPHYSPLNLHHLPQPVPSDATPSTDASIFTFEDAFEDLLAVSQGQPLPDIGARYERRKLLSSMFPEGEPAFFWLRRLQSQGLITIPEPSQFLRQAESNWDQFHRELDRRAANVWSAVVGEDNQHNSRDVYEDANNFPESFRDRSNQHRDPNHFDDLFSSVRSSFPESQSSWDTFVKSFNRSPSDKASQEQLDKNQKVTKDEYVDRFGYLHSKVTVQTLDEEGKQIGSQTHYTVRPANKDNDEQSDESKDDKSGLHASGKVETKASWFWK